MLLSGHGLQMSWVGVLEDDARISSVLACLFDLQSDAICRPPTRTSAARCKGGQLRIDGVPGTILGLAAACPTFLLLSAPRALVAARFGALECSFGAAASHRFVPCLLP